MEFYPIRV